MLIEVIRAARDATQKANDTKAAMRDVCSVSSRYIIKYNSRSASHIVSVAAPMTFSISAVFMPILML